MALDTIPDDLAVYVAFKSVFTGQAAQIRQLPAIQKLIDKHQEHPHVAQLLQQYTAPVIYQRIRRLLGDQIFESTLKAECRFPQLFEVSRSQSAERTVSEAESAAGHTKADENAIASDGRADPPFDSDYEIRESGADQQDTALIRLPTKQEIAPPSLDIPSLFPAKFSFVTGYRILMKTQEVLELACFRFAEKAMPGILQEQKWHCPESAELNLWTAEFSKRLKKFQELPSAASSLSKPLEELFLSIAQIRHYAVHRTPVTAKELEQFMADGETLALLFKDGVAISVMSRAKSEVQKAAAEMANKKSTLEAILAKTLQRIADQRAELNRLEREAIEDMKREDGEYQLCASAHLQQTIWLDDGAVEVEEALSPTKGAAANETFKDSLVDCKEAVMKSDLALHGEFKAEDAPEEESIAPAVGKPSHGEPDGSRLSTQAEEDPTKSLEPADTGGDGFAAEK